MHSCAPLWDFCYFEINSTAFRPSLRGLAHFKCSLQWISANYSLTDKHLQSILKISTAQLSDSRTHWRHQIPAAGIRVHLEKVGHTLSADTLLNTRLPPLCYKWGCKAGWMLVTWPSWKHNQNHLSKVLINRALQTATWIYCKGKLYVCIPVPKHFYKTITLTLLHHTLQIPTKKIVD